MIDGPGAGTAMGAPGVRGAVGIAVLLAASTAAATNGDAYEALVQRYLVARHCGLVTRDVMDGFRIEIMTLLSTGTVTAAEARAGRRAAGEAVRQGWRNRGQGDRDPRCRIEGLAAATYFSDALHGND